MDFFISHRETSLMGIISFRDHGLLQKNRLCPKPAQTLPEIRATMPPGTIPALGERSGYPMENDGRIRKSLVHRTFLEYCKQLLNFNS